MGDKQAKYDLTAVKTGLLYFVFAVLWITVTDGLIGFFVSDIQTVFWLQIVKGWLFVLFSTVLLYWLIRRYNKNLERSRDRYFMVEKDARHGKHRFDLIAKTTSDVLYEWYVPTGEVWWSDGWCAKFGFQPDDIESSIDWWEQIVAEDERDEVLQSLEQAVQGNDEHWFREYTIVNSAGDAVIVRDHGYFLRSEDGTAKVMVGSITNITAEKDMLRVLRQSEEQYRLLFHFNPNPMWIFNPENFTFVEVNQAAIEHYGYTRDEFLSMTLFDIRPRKDIEKVKKSIGQNRFESETTFEEWEHIKKNGEHIIVRTSASSINFYSETYRLVVIIDITRQKMAEEKIIMSTIRGSEQERRRVAKELHDGLGQILAAASLNLGSVESAFEIAGAKFKERFLKGVGQINRAIDETRRIAYNLSPKAIEEFGLSEAVCQLVEELRSESDIRFTYNQSLGDHRFSNLVEINIYRIIQESVNNALKHASCRTIHIQLTMKNEMLTCTVEDDGKGFNDRSIEESGLGLQNMKNRAQAMKGFLEVKSKIGAGTVVLAEIPVHFPGVGRDKLINLTV